MKRLYRSLFSSVAIVAGLWLIFEFASRLFAEILWFREVDYSSVFLIRSLSQSGLWLLITLISGLFIGGNLWLAHRWQWRWQTREERDGDGVAVVPLLAGDKTSPSKPVAGRLAQKQLLAKKTLSKQNYTSSLQLPLLLITAIALAVGIICILLIYAAEALSVWETSYQLPQIAATFRPPLDLFNWSNLTGFLASYLRQLSAVVILVGLLLWKPQTSLRAIAILISLAFGFIAAGNWTIILSFFYPTSFNLVDPQFQKNIGFYIFRLPLWQLLEFWLIGLCSCTLLSCILFYLLSGNSLSEGKFPGFTKAQMRHLSWLGATSMVALAIRHWLNRFDLLYSDRGVVYGASYTNVKVQLPFEIGLTVVALASALWLFYQGIKGYRQRRLRIILLGLPIIVYLALWFASAIAGDTVQRLVVQPNELVKETPYIERSIQMTRQAFNLDNIDVQTFNPQGQLTGANIADNDSTISNIRLWDTRPILQTNRQLQQIRPYYQFHDADIDRYRLRQIDTNIANKQQVIIAARELDYAQVENIAKTWVNEHLIYTHGYGFTLSPVNRVEEGGLPFYYIKDIGTGDRTAGSLTISDEVIRQSIPIGKPRIYFGELTNPYIMTSTKVRELDFPSGEENVYTVYDGTGGIKIGSYFRRLLFAQYLKDWQMLFAQSFTPKTKLLFRRNIKQRVQEIAPFLSYDQDPYLVAARTNNQPNNPNRLYWIIDAYTTSDRYPYSDPGKNPFNYLRNSVKVVIDAYNGKVNFYIADPSDPIIRTWNKIFPQLFKPLTSMPLDLRRHIRYPEDLFSTQSERLLTYHMEDPQVFYNREDQWQIPKEIYGNKSQPVAPYYLIMKLPTAKEEEFILLHPYTPTSRPNLIAWLAARSDGAEYGKLLLYKFPKQKLIFGPNQIEALINQDPVISQQISLWNREGSRAIQGNLLIIPLEQSLLYVEPLYIEAEENSLPALARVIVIYENQIVMAETLDEGIEAIFQTPNNAEPIIRSVEDVTPEN
ncbi:MAG: UPF0182 family protein [Cyanobacteria bacterium J06621_8]